mmetsp:Transcript_24810/g.75577  ORF Transcript_24810/g.75577 Transcript_24810/m.75577 type:complete len:216 (+) Transcript_24810:432-1079(+)
MAVCTVSTEAVHIRKFRIVESANKVAESGFLELGHDEGRRSIEVAHDNHGDRPALLPLKLHNSAPKDSHVFPCPGGVVVLDGLQMHANDEEAFSGRHTGTAYIEDAPARRPVEAFTTTINYTEQTGAVNKTEGILTPCKHVTLAHIHFSFIFRHLSTLSTPLITIRIFHQIPQQLIEKRSVFDAAARVAVNFTFVAESRPWRLLYDKHVGLFSHN